MTVFIDDEAKLSIRLFRQTDRMARFFYIGKIQFPGTLDFERGVSFMIFTANRGKERMLIGPIKKPERALRIGKTKERTDCLSVDLHSFNDSEGNVAYVGEAKCQASINITNGIFFTVFLSRKGEEELQIKELNHKKESLSFKTS